MDEQTKVVLAKISDIIAKQLGLQAPIISMEQAFVDDLGADSLDVVELTMAMEDEFGFEIPEEIARGMKTVGDAVTYVCKTL